MAIDQHIARIEKIRLRFAINLGRKIDILDNTLPRLSGQSSDTINAIAKAHRSIHALCGIGPTVGFSETGRAARSVERILIQPLRAKRGLSESEIVSLKHELDTLRIAAKTESQSVTSAQR